MDLQPAACALHAIVASGLLFQLTLLNNLHVIHRGTAG